VYFALLVGFLFGFIGSIPVAGPISALVLKKSLTGEHKAAALVGLGGAIAEAIYASVALWGFSAVLDRYPIIDPISRAVACAILVALGISFMRYKDARAEDESKAKPKGKATALRSFLLGFTITIVNPTLIATWTASAATLAGSGIVFTSSHAPLFGLGSFVGIAGWFTLFVFLLRKFGKRFSANTLSKVVRVIGGLVLLVGLWFGYRFVRYITG
jgi:threonine/homoserine/homoserine lactone efflux protein